MSDSGLQERELRIAPVMTGGTSLSVWMGGATLELYHLLGAARAMSGSEPIAPEDSGVYARLLSLTVTRPVVDVITGTSAGGLNGSILAAALAWDVPLREFERLEEIWMDSADVSKLLWRAEETPPAIFDGDAAFVPPILRQLSLWATQAVSLGERSSKVDLVTTFTTAHPRGRSVVDDFGDRLHEQTYAGTVRYCADDFVKAGADGCSANPQLAAMLAWGARASASIPGVFAPVFLNTSGRLVAPSADGDARPSPAEVDFGDRVSVGGRVVGGDGVWAVDGGLVNNLPLEDSLDRIFSLRSVGPVRRVVLYVSPTPTEVPDVDDRLDDRPSLKDSVAKIVAAPRAEGVGDSIDEIRDHNAAVARQRAARVAMSLLPRLDSETPRAGILDPLFSVYRRRRAEESVARTVADLDAYVSHDDPDSPTRAAIGEALLAARMHADLLPTSLPDLDGWHEQSWAWGISPIEQAISTVIGIVNRTWTLPQILPSDQATQDACDKLVLTKTACHDVLDALESMRKRDSAYWSTTLPKLAATKTSQLERVAGELYRAWPGSDREKAMSDLGNLMLRVSEVLREAEPHLTHLLGLAGANTSPVTASGDGPPEPDSRGPARIALAEEAESIYRELCAIVVPGTPETQTGVWIGIAFLESHVLQTVLFGEVQPREQPVEVMQLSWNSKDHLSDRTAAEKLTGTEFARLGAFVLPHWRANDFLWGQLDAAPRLIQLIADPRRLAQVGKSAGVVLTELGLTADSVGAETREALEAELSFLSGPAAVPPDLPQLTAVLARQRQLEIARAGLPKVGKAVVHAENIGATITSAARNFLGELEAGPGLRSDDDVINVMGVLRIGEETMRDQIDSPLVNQYSAQLVKIIGRTTEALSGSDFARKNGWVEPAAVWVRWLTTSESFVTRALGWLRRLRD